MFQIVAVSKILDKGRRDIFEKIAVTSADMSYGEITSISNFMVCKVNWAKRLYQVVFTDSSLKV